MTSSVPTRGFLLRHPAHFLALGFGAGLAPIAPGTVGTLVALPIAAVLWKYTNDAVFVAAVCLLFAVGVWAAGVTGRDLGEPDHSSIVWDEVVGFLLVLYFLGSDNARVAAGFVLFRLFDILKPPPIRQFDAALKNGFGVMVDDVLAAGYALLVFALWQRVWGS